jgi:hypothetical protein
MKKLYNKIQLELDNDTIEKTIDDYEVLDYYEQLTLVNPCQYYSKKYNDYYFCYNYAFKKSFKLLSEIEDAFKILLDYYEPIEKYNAREGDIISFHSIDENYKRNNRPSDVNCNHFAIVSDIKISLNTGDEVIFIKSKWGVMGVFEGKISDLPENYGNCFMIWRKKKIYSPTEKKETIRNKIGSYLPLTK